jgi:AraC-like DNA-binding protein
MAIAAFLPPANADYVCHTLVANDLILATSWSDLESHMRNPATSLTLVDPSAEGEMNIAAVSRILKRHRDPPVAAYVPLSCENLKAVLYLSARGLRQVFLHPMIDDGKQLFVFARRLAGHHLAYEFLGLFETRLACLHPRLVSALTDLFERPHRYETAADIGRESRLSTKCVYRVFQRAGLGTPKKFVTAAKLLRGYAYLREGSDCLKSVSKEVGYSGARTFSSQMAEIFGCSPVRLRKEANVTEVVAQLVEWVQKPDRRSEAR